MRKLIMKCADERRREFAVITSIWEEDGVKSVVKAAVYPEGRAHLENMERYGKLLGEAYPAVKACPSRMTDEGLAFDFVEGSSLEDRYRLAVQEGDRDALILYMKNHAELLDSARGSQRFPRTQVGGRSDTHEMACESGSPGSFRTSETFLEGTADAGENEYANFRTTETPQDELGEKEENGFAYFRATESFREWFGDAEPYEGREAYEFANFDATASNIILRDGQPVFIDYEWVAEFPIPRDLVVYHAIRDSYYHIPEMEALLPLREAMEILGVGTELDILQKSYEHFFFRYVYGSDSKAGLSVLTDRKKIEYLANERTLLAERMWKENERAVITQRTQIDELTRELAEARKNYADLDQSWFWRWDEERAAMQRLSAENARLSEALRLMEEDRDAWKANFESVTNSKSYRGMMKVKGVLGKK
ncbi:MAG: hypothetical protein Q4A32_07790 [Lachnospiraceae bacterium]|nr:hypothetical protein [Lachnospiraceae bacterium]